MEPAYLSAVAALTGSAVGGLASFIGSLLGKNAQLKADLLLHDKSSRQQLYLDFINEASRLYIDAVTHDEPDLSKAVTLYALINRMRIVSSPKVVDAADKVAQQIADSYAERNKTFGEIHSLVKARALDPLLEFSRLCREELQGLLHENDRRHLRELARIGSAER